MLLNKVEETTGSILVIVVMVEVQRWSSSRGRLGFVGDCVDEQEREM